MISPSRLEGDFFGQTYRKIFTTRLELCEKVLALSRQKAVECLVHDGVQFLSVRFGLEGGAAVQVGARADVEHAFEGRFRDLTVRLAGLEVVVYRLLESRF